MSADIGNNDDNAVDGGERLPTFVANLVDGHGMR